MIMVFILKMTRFGKWLSRVIRKFDLFATPQYLRYKGEPQFKTATGGFSSLAIIIILFVMSSTMGMQMINKQVINSSAVYNNEVDPSNYTITFGQGQFMLAVSLLNSTNNVRFVNYFSVVMYPKMQTPQAGLQVLEPIYFVPCTSEHFNNNNDTLEMYSRMQLNQSLCPPLGYSILIGGRESSNVFSYFSLEVMQCNPQFNGNCVSDSQFSSTFANSNELIKISIPYVNTIINAGEQDYKQIYVEDMNYFFFTMNNAIYVTAKIEKYEVNTDQTLMPYSDIVSEYLPAIPYPFASSMIPVSSHASVEQLHDVYAVIVFSKIAETTIFYRSFTKLDTYFSYVGGLIGTIIGAFFLMRNYSQYAYLISIAEKVFNYDDHNEIHSKGFNFFQYFKMGVKRWLQFFEYEGDWPMTDMFLRSAQQMSQQLSIELLLQKISYLQEAVSSLLDQHQLEALILKEKRPILSAEYTRKKNRTSKNILAEMLEKMKIGNRSENVIRSNSPSPYKQPRISSKNELRDNDQNYQTGEHMFKTNMQSEVKEKSDHIEGVDPNDRGKIEAMEMIRTSLFRVISEGESGHPTSKKIISRTNKKILEELGIKKGAIQQEQFRENFVQPFTLPDSAQEIQVLSVESVRSQH